MLKQGIKASTHEQMILVRGVRINGLATHLTACFYPTAYLEDGVVLSEFKKAF